MGEAGRISDLTDELIKKIKECILDGKNLKDTAKHIFNNYPNLREEEKIKGEDNYIQKIYNWNSQNYLNINDKIEGWQRDRRLILANITSDKIQTLPIEDEEGKIDKELLKIKQKESEFIRETLGKEYYSKRNEFTGKNGGAIEIKDISILDKEAEKTLNVYRNSIIESGSTESVISSDIQRED